MKKPEKFYFYTMNGISPVNDNSPVYKNAERMDMDVFAVDTVCRYLISLEERIFDRIRHPNIILRDLSIDSIENDDRKFIEKEAIELYSYFSYRPSYEHFVNVIWYYWDIYVKLLRLNRRKAIKNFYYDAIRYFFIYVYEARMNMNDDYKFPSYLKRFQ